jgi:hypothetical protein
LATTTTTRTKTRLLTPPKGLVNLRRRQSEVARYYGGEYTFRCSERPLGWEMSGAERVVVLDRETDE